MRNGATCAHSSRNDSTYYVSRRFGHKIAPAARCFCFFVRGSGPSEAVGRRRSSHREIKNTPPRQVGRQSGRRKQTDGQNIARIGSVDPGSTVYKDLGGLTEWGNRRSHPRVACDGRNLWHAWGQQLNNAAATGRRAQRRPMHSPAAGGQACPRPSRVGTLSDPRTS